MHDRPGSPGEGTLETILLIALFMALIAIGVLLPVMTAMHLLRIGSHVPRGPIASGMLMPMIRGTAIAAVTLVLGMKILGLRRHVDVVVAYFASLIAYALFIPLVVASALALPIGAIGRALGSADAGNAWRPLLYIALAMLGACYAVKAMADERHEIDHPELYPDGTPGPAAGATGARRAGAGASTTPPSPRANARSRTPATNCTANSHLWSLLSSARVMVAQRAVTASAAVGIRQDRQARVLSTHLETR
jgi:hypothetical protein